MSSLQNASLENPIIGFSSPDSKTYRSMTQLKLNPREWAEPKLHNPNERLPVVPVATSCYLPQGITKVGKDSQGRYPRHGAGWTLRYKELGNGLLRISPQGLSTPGWINIVQSDGHITLVPSYYGARDCDKLRGILTAIGE